MKLRDIRIRDPFLLQDEETIYLYGTTDQNTWDGKGTGFDYYTTFLWQSQFRLAAGICKCCNCNLACGNCIFAFTEAYYIRNDRGISKGLKMKLRDIRIRDPFLLQDEETIYLYGTTDQNTWDGKGTGFDYYTTKDMKHFEGPFPALRPPEDFWADKNFWAPEVWKWNGKYYMIAFFKKEGMCRGVQILTADRASGPFVPVGNAPITPGNWECLDGTLYMQGEHVYLIFSHEWLQAGDGEICVLELDTELKAAKGNPTVLFRASEADWTAVHREFGAIGFVTDGPFLFEEDGILNLIWSSYSSKGYSIGLSFSREGIFGEWHHCSKPLFADDGGHGMLFSYGGEKWIVIHSPNELQKERVRFLKWGKERI